MNQITCGVLWCGSIPTRYIFCVKMVREILRRSISIELSAHDCYEEGTEWIYTRISCLRSVTPSWWRCYKGILITSLLQSNMKQPGKRLVCRDEVRVKTCKLYR